MTPPPEEEPRISAVCCLRIPVCVPVLCAHSITQLSLSKISLQLCHKVTQANLEKFAGYLLVLDPKLEEGATLSITTVMGAVFRASWHEGFVSYSRLLRRVKPGVVSRPSLPSLPTASQLTFF